MSLVAAGKKRRMLTQLALPIGIGVGAALLAVLDPLLSFSLHLRYSHRELAHLLPYELTLVVLAVAMAVVIFFVLLARHWEKRTSFVVVLLFFSAQVPALAIGRLNPIDVVLLVLFFLWVIHLCVDPAMPIASTPLNGLCLCFGLGVILSVVNNTLVPFMSGVTSYGSKVVAFFLIYNLVRTREQAKVALKVLIISGAFSAIVALIQYGVWLATGLPITLADFKDVWEPTPWGMWFRATAFFTKPNSLGNFLSITAIISLYLVFSNGVSRRNRRWLIAAFLLMCLALGLTFSRGGWLAVCIAIFLLPFIMKPKYSIHYILMGAVLLFLLYVTGVIEYSIEFLDSLNPHAVAFRSKLFSLGAEAFVRHPFVGVGVNNFADFSGNHFRAPVHNGILQVFSEMGLAGGLPWIAIILALLVRSIITYARSLGRGDSVIIGCSMLGLITLLAHMQSEPLANSPMTWVYFGYMEAINLVYDGRLRPRFREQGSSTKEVTGSE